MQSTDEDVAVGVARGMLLRGVAPATAAGATGLSIAAVEGMAMEMAYDSLCDGDGVSRATHGVSAQYRAQAPVSRREAQRIADHAERMRKARPQTEAELQALIAEARRRTRVLPPGEAHGTTAQRDRAGRRHS